MNKAKKYREYKIGRKLIDIFKQNVIISRAEIMHARDKCQTAYLRALFITWHRELADLKEERLTLEAK